MPGADSDLDGLTAATLPLNPAAKLYVVDGIFDRYVLASDVASGSSGPTVRTLGSGVTSYTVVDADVNNFILTSQTSATGICTITIPSSLTRKGAITVVKGATGNVRFAFSGVTPKLENNTLNTITTINHSMVAISLDSLTSYLVAGAEA